MTQPSDHPAVNAAIARLNCPGCACTTTGTGLLISVEKLRPCLYRLGLTCLRCGFHAPVVVRTEFPSSPQEWKAMEESAKSRPGPIEGDELLAVHEATTQLPDEDYWAALTAPQPEDVSR